MNESRTRGRTIYLSSVFAIFLAGLVGFGVWYRNTHVSANWMAIDDPQIAHLFTDSAEVQPDEKNGFGFTYTTSWQEIQPLFASVPDGWRSYRIDRDSITASFDTAEDAQRQLDALRAADVPPAGVFMFRGFVRDAENKPVPNATIDLMGPWVFINHFRTRDDGSFVMPMKTKTGSPPPKWGYSLRVRAEDETAQQHHRWSTRRFSLDAAEPHWGVIITLPETL